MKKFLIALLLICTLLALVACNGDGDDGTTPTVPGGDTNPADMLPLVRDGVLQYELVYGTAEEKALATQIKTHLESLGITVGAPVSDYSYKNNTDKPQILIGNTKYAESQAVKYETRSKDYTIEPRGTKLVVFAHTFLGNTYRTNAINKLKNLFTEAVAANGVTNIQMFEKTSEASTYAYNAIQLNGVDVRSYRIVYAKGMADCAEVWQTWIAQQVGYVLETAQDGKLADDGGYEILIGKTNRAASQAAFETYTELDYKFYFADKKAVAAVDSEWTNSTLFGPGQGGAVTVGRLIIRNKDSETKISNLPADTRIEGNVRTLSTSNYPLTEGAEIRVMSFNILSQLQGWVEGNTKLTPLSVRVPLLKHHLRVTNPDIIGLQEVTGENYNKVGTESWNAKLEEMLASLGYSVVYLRTDNGDGDTNPCYNPIAYKTDKYDFLVGGHRAYDANNGNDASEAALRNTVWGLFREKADTARSFILVNTHWSFADKNTGSTAVQDEQTKEMVKLVNSLRTTFGVPIFTTGDYNANPSTTALNYLMDNANLSRSGAYTDANTQAYQGIDHVFYSEGVTVIGQYKVMEAEFATTSATYRLSDHHAVYADFTFAPQSPLPDPLPEYTYPEASGEPTPPAA